MMFSGLRSRWTIPARWMAAIADATRRPMRSANASGSGAPSAFTSCARSTSPATYSIATHGPCTGESPASSTRTSPG